MAQEAFQGDGDWRSAWNQHKREIFNLLLVSLLCALAVSINPHGLQMLLYPFKTVSIQVLQDYILEWQSPNFTLSSNAVASNRNFIRVSSQG